MSVHPYPKPAPLPKKGKSPIPSRSKRKAKKKKITSICVDCFSLWRGGVQYAEHDPLCEGELTVVTKNANKTERQMVNEALDYVFREFTKWRDGVRCVIHGDACGRYSEWGHVIPQGSCSYLVYEPSNSFRQSDECNQIHRFVQAPYYDWYKATWGNTAYKMLVDAWKNAPKGGRTTLELFELLQKYTQLYKNRFSMNGTTRTELVAAGYYGEIIKEAWIKDGRI